MVMLQLVVTLLVAIEDGLADARCAKRRPQSIDGGRATPVRRAEGLVLLYKKRHKNYIRRG
jgi:hypothetical protein